MTKRTENKRTSEGMNDWPSVHDCMLSFTHTFVSSYLTIPSFVLSITLKLPYPTLPSLLNSSLVESSKTKTRISLTTTDKQTNTNIVETSVSTRNFVFFRKVENIESLKMPNLISFVVILGVGLSQMLGSGICLYGSFNRSMRRIRLLCELWYSERKTELDQYI